MSGNEAEALSPVKRALLEIRELRARLAEAEAARAEPVAIIGLGLRLPGGVRDLDGLETLLWSGTDAVGPIPPERFPADALYDSDPDKPGRMTTRHGAFLDAVDRFDADFFGIAPREAASMDPQQRLLLEVAWEALEDAGHAPASLAGSRTGVYLGIANGDYGRALFARPGEIDAYYATGNAFSVAAGRLSYILGLQGPSIAVDTACSSSLVALHLACQALRLRECDMALAGAANLILTPELNINFSKARMMAPDGRCKPFDAAADGYVRGEGVGVLALRRLSDAQAAGDRILAVIRGTAVNQDGRSNGLTAPNGPAQEAVIRAALAASGVAPGAVGYVEAHGTGTPLGDPIEMGALGAVFGPGRDRAAPLAVGSVKGNLGHLEAAAGIAGLAKLVLALRRGEIPPQLHFHEGNPFIDWAGLPVTVPVAPAPWARREGRRLAGISSFGFSGTNAHAVLEEAPAAAQARATAERPLHLLALSARDDAALRELAGRYAAALPDGGPEGASERASLADLCFTANAGRSHFAHRLAVVGGDAMALRRGLAAFETGAADASLLSGNAEGAAPRVAFLFTGQGAQYAGMARQLYATAPVFRRALDRCADGLAPFLPQGLLALLDAADNSLDRTENAQPALFAVEYALAALWRSWGVEPAAVLGHSLGEYAAAAMAGVLDLDDALRLVAERGRLTGALPAGGAMAAVFAPEAVVSAALPESGSLSVAAVNGPEHIVISGAREVVAAALARFAEQGIRTRELRVSFAAHSLLVAPVLPEFRQVLEGVRFNAPRVALVSNVTGALAGPDELARPEYWLDHLRAPVRFAQSMATLRAQGITHCVEIGPHPVLLGMAAECVPGDSSANGMAWLPSLRRDRADWSDLLESLQRLYVDGAEIDWAGFDRDAGRRRVALPTYPFQRQRHWIALSPAPAEADAAEHHARLALALDREAERGPLDLNAASYPAKWDCLARLTLAHAVRTLRESGLFAAAGEAHTLESVLERAGIDARYRHIVRRWLDRLAAQDALREAGGEYRAAAPLPAPDLPALWAEAEQLFADNVPLLDYVRHCGTLVGRVLRGEESPLETLFPGGSDTLARGLYERSTTMRYMNGLAAASFAALAEGVPPGRRLRVLEVGAGSGATTASLLPALPPGRYDYLFTDVSDLFLERAQARFAAFGGVRYARYDMDHDPAEQGLAPGSFDVIVSANAVHASADLRLALARLRALLAPGGTLLLVESTTHFDWFDMTTGLIEGWQHFADDLRGDDPLLSAPRWVAALEVAGFAAAHAWPGEASAARHLGQHLLVAQAGGEGAVGTAEASRAAPAAAPAAPDAAAESVRQGVLDALPAERLDILREFVRAQVMRVLRRDAGHPPGLHERLMDLGLDSLMAVQLRGLLGAGLELEEALPASLMFDQPTVAALAEHLLARVLPPEPVVPETAPAIAASPAALSAATVAGLSDAEIEALLMERLGER